uniref:Uncharacterized protein n=1 Tax=Panagrellus redivivus TaxID=6233 RepID=A0A7E4ZVP7_PANRE
MLHRSIAESHQRQQRPLSKTYQRLPSAYKLCYVSWLHSRTGSEYHATSSQAKSGPRGAGAVSGENVFDANLPTARIVTTTPVSVVALIMVAVEATKRHNNDESEPQSEVPNEAWPSLDCCWLLWTVAEKLESLTRMIVAPGVVAEGGRPQ